MPSTFPDWKIEFRSPSADVVACLVHLWQYSKPTDGFSPLDFGALIHFGLVRAGESEFNTWQLTSAGLAVLNLLEAEYRRGVEIHGPERQGP
jgi:hypothetical protein